MLSVAQYAYKWFIINSIKVLSLCAVYVNGICDGDLHVRCLFTFSK